MTRLLPRYLYHFTNAENYNNMLKTGKLMATNDQLFGKCICMIEQDNFIKNWNKINSKKSSLFYLLMNYVLKDSSRLVLLRIPTEKLKTDELKIRSQNVYFAALTNKMIFLINKHLKGIKPYDSEWKIKLSEILTKLIPKQKKHLMEGDIATNRNLYSQRKEAIEYLYPNDVNMKDVTKVGEVNLSGDSISLITKKKDLLSLIFSGNPEEKSLFML